MPERPTSRLATSVSGRRALFAGISDVDERLQRNLLRLRAVLFLLGAVGGSKVTTARTLADELRARRSKASIRSLYRWRRSYLRFGFAGIARRRRDDAGCPRRLVLKAIPRIVDAATRVKRHGDLAREFRGLRTGVSSETFRLWVRRIQRQLRVVELPERGK